MALAEDMADGAKNHGAAIGLKQNDEPAIRADLAAARVAVNAYNIARNSGTGFHTALRVADANANAFLKAARAVLAQNLGQSWTTKWAPTGFPNQSTAVPDTQDARFTLCQSLADFFTKNPTLEINTPKLVVTAAAAQACHDALDAARTAVNDGNTVIGGAKTACDDAVAALRTRMRGLINELGQLLDDNDPLWEAFGLTEPGADSTPDSPTALTLTAGPAGTVQSNWTAAARADHYRVYKQIAGVDADFVDVAGPTIRNLR